MTNELFVVKFVITGKEFEVIDLEPEGALFVATTAK
jgi:hypothetical protein